MRYYAILYNDILVLCCYIYRYYILGFSFNEKVRVNKQSCEILLKRVKLKNWALGKSKVSSDRRDYYCKLNIM